MPQTHPLATAAAVLVLLTAGCTAPAPPPPATPGAPVGPTPATATAPAHVDAGALARRLAAADMAVSSVTVQDAASDPNHLLGRPGGYTSRASFVLGCANEGADPGSVDAGGVIEVFPDAAGAARRLHYIGALAQNAPELATEYGYQHGPVLLRITAACPPETAATVDAALAAGIR